MPGQMTAMVNAISLLFGAEGCVGHNDFRLWHYVVEIDDWVVASASDVVHELAHLLGWAGEANVIENMVGHESVWVVSCGAKVGDHFWGGKWGRSF